MTKTPYNIIKSCHVFSELPDADICALAKLAQMVKVNKEDRLFYRDDTSRDAYIVVSGKLAATTGTTNHAGELIDFIMPGEILGEMSLLAGTPRSLTITADTDAELLKIGYQDFQECCQNSPKIAFNMLELVIKRTQGVIKHMDKPKHAQFIALLPANEAVMLNTLICALQQEIHQHTHQHIKLQQKALVLSEDDIKAAKHDLNTLFLNLKQKYEFILYPINPKITSLAGEILYKYADKIVLAGHGNQIGRAHV